MCLKERAGECDSLAAPQSPEKYVSHLTFKRNPCLVKDFC